MPNQLLAPFQVNMVLQFVMTVIKRLKLWYMRRSDLTALPCVLSIFSFQRKAVIAQFGLVSVSISASSCIAATSSLDLGLK